MLKKRQVVMLPTNQKATNLYKCGHTLSNFDSLFLQKEKGIPQHLYFLSDEDIKEGDWYYDSKLNQVFSKSNPQINRVDWQKKIIATTDSSSAC